MKFHGRSAHHAPIDEERWLGLATTFGIGLVLAETTLPSLLGDMMLRTVWLGVSTDDGSVKAYRTLRQVLGRGWCSLQEYEDEADARAGHMRWVAASMASE